MDCIECKKLINLFLDGCLPDGQEQEIFSHIESCPDCEQYYEDLSEIVDRLAEPEKELPQGFTHMWQDKVAQLAHKKRKPNYKALLPALAACVCGVFVLSMVLFSNNTQAPTQLPWQGQGLAIATPSVQEAAQDTPQDVTSGDYPDAGQTVQSGQQDGMAAEINSLFESSVPETPEESGQTQGDELEGNVPAKGDADTLTQEEPSIMRQSQAENKPYLETYTDENGETKHVLNLAGVAMDMEEMEQFAQDYNITMTHTERGLHIKSTPFVIKTLLEHFGLEDVPELEELEIIQQPQPETTEQ